MKSKSSKDDELFTVKNVSEIIGLNLATLYAITKYDKLPSEVIGSRRVVRKEAIDEWIKNNLKPKEEKEGKK